MSEATTAKEEAIELAEYALGLSADLFACGFNAGWLSSKGPGSMDGSGATQATYEAEADRIRDAMRRAREQLRRAKEGGAL